MPTKSPTFSAWVLLSAGVFWFFDVSIVHAFAVAAIVLVVAKDVFERLVDAVDDDQDERHDEPVAARNARDAYVAGEIGERELERRLERALDPDVREIRERFEPVDGVGRETCYALADRFGTVRAIENASADELEQVDGVGEQRATALVATDVDE